MNGLPLPNTVIRASAGSGKTFQLSNRYITLLAEGADCASILASTFTKKAAGEILDRIAIRLSAAAAEESGPAEESGSDRDLRAETSGESLLLSSPGPASSCLSGYGYCCNQTVGC